MKRAAAKAPLLAITCPTPTACPHPLSAPTDRQTLSLTHTNTQTKTQTQTQTHTSTQTDRQTETHENSPPRPTLCCESPPPHPNGPAPPTRSAPEIAERKQEACNIPRLGAAFLQGDSPGTAHTHPDPRPINSRSHEIPVL
eukprot:797232-Rhodomonas_salina.1